MVFITSGIEVWVSKVRLKCDLTRKFKNNNVIFFFYTHIWTIAKLEIVIEGHKNHNWKDLGT